MVTKILDILLIAFKLLGELPKLYDKVQTYKKDKKYRDAVEARNKAYDDFMFNPNDHKARLTALKKLRERRK